MNKIPLIENACKELLQYGVRDGRDRCKDLAKRLLLGRKMPGNDPVFWPTGLLAAGLWHCREEDTAKRRGSAEVPDAADRTEIIECALAAYYERWFRKGMPLTVLDDLLAGETLLAVYQEIQKGGFGFNGKLSADRLRTALDKMASYAAAHPQDEAGSFLYRPANGEKTVFADGIGLAVPFLYRYGEVFDKPEYGELALRQIANFFSYGMDGKTGLPYHGYDMAAGCKYGIIGWGRAAGWLLRGMAGCMISDYGRERLGTACMALTDAVLAFQRPDGYFSWQLEAAEGPADTSVTGMVCAVVRMGMEAGWLAGENYEKALSAGRSALLRSVRDGLVYDCSGECEGFSCYPQRYGAYPWSLGPALEALAPGQ